MGDEDETTPPSKRVVNGVIMKWLHTGNRESMRFLLRILGYQPCEVCDYIDDHCKCATK